MKKIMTIVGTRPELIRLSEIIKKLDKYTNHTFVHTGQNFTYELNEQFYKSMNIREPDYQLNSTELTGVEFISDMLLYIEEILIRENPDAILILGDTNSGLSALICKQHNIPVFHMEAGNRCYSDEVPEEANRKVIDSLSTYLLPYTQRSREQLLLEGYKPQNIIVTGNPIFEVMMRSIKKSCKDKIDQPFVLATIHRTENVTNKDNLENIMTALNLIITKYPVVLSMHPKLKSMIKKYNIYISPKIIQHEPFNFNDFLGLEESALCVITDSGTVPEECAILHTPCVLVRNSTERPELLEVNEMILSGTKANDILNAFETVIGLDLGMQAPEGYNDWSVSDKIVKIMLRCIQ